MATNNNKSQASKLKEAYEKELDLIKNISDPEEKLRKEVSLAETRKKMLLAQYKAEPKVSVYLPPSYAPYLGRVTQLCINEIYMSFRVDGSRQELPQSFADLLEEKRLNIDAILNKQMGMSNVSNNVESSPGALKFN